MGGQISELHLVFENACVILAQLCGKKTKYEIREGISSNQQNWGQTFMQVCERGWLRMWDVEHG